MARRCQPARSSPRPACRGGQPNYVRGPASHTYADTASVNGGNGTYTITVFVQDDGGSRLTITNTATVIDNPLSVTGAINPASVSGLSTGTPNVTNVTQPNFYGTVLATLPDRRDCPKPTPR